MDLCDVCQKRPFELLCDYQNGSGIVTSINFKQLTSTCDKKMCQECAVNIWFDGDVCPEHANEIYKAIVKQSNNRKRED